nr:hypothetical protein [Tanacetum cinerariifolium]
MEGNKEGNEPESASAPTKTATRSAGRSTQVSRSRQASVSESALAEEPIQTTSQMEEPSHPEFDTGAEDQPIVQSSQHPEWLKVDTLTLELLDGPTYELIKGSCKSLVELEYHLEEVFKATTDQLDWVNPEGQQYPHNLLKPLPLIPNNRGRHVIPFEHFINNDLEYLRGGASSRTYTTSTTKTKAADYRHIKWIEDLFYGFAVKRESARDVYSKRRIIAITELKIVEWHSYKHLDWITVRRDDDKLYKFKEGDFKRLRIQDIEDMLLILIQGKLTNLTVEECFAINVSLRMFTRSIVIQRRVEDLQLGNKDKRNGLMRIDELHKFSDGTLTDVCTALDDRLKGIWMQYLPQSIWRKSNKDRAATMIQAIDRRLKTRRIMRSLERNEMEYQKDRPCNPDGRNYWIKTSQDSMPHAHTCKDIMKAQALKETFQKYTGKELQTYRRELIYYMDILEMNIGRRALYESECLMKAREDGSSSSRHATDAEEARINKVVSDKNNAAVRPLFDNDTLAKDRLLRLSYVAHKENEKYVETDYLDFHMLLPKEDNDNTGKQGLGFENQNDGDNTFILNKTK